MAKYLIKLYPIDRYFFGGEITFGADNANYFVRSVYFPQQTTLLGMLRYYLLLQNNMLDDKGKVLSSPPKDEKDLIGSKGFNASSASEFGIIKNLSPVFITSPDGEYFVQSREFGLQWQEDEVSGEKKQELIPLKLRKRNGINSFSQQHIGYFEGFNAKTVIPDLLVNARSGKVCYFDYMEERKHDLLNGIFIPNEQIGIRIPKNEDERDNNEKGFYRQIGYTMPQGFGFAFYAEIDKGNNTFKSGLVRMGADQSWFRIEITGETDKHTSIGDYSSLTANLFRKVNDFNEKVVLLSDCFIEETEYKKKCPFASVSTVLFRYLKIDPNGTYSLKGAGFKLKKSDEYLTLLKKGSVLFVNSKEEKIELIKYLQSIAAFYQIGYNHAI